MGFDMTCAFNKESMAALKTLLNPSSYDKLKLYVKKTAMPVQEPGPQRYKYTLILEGEALNSKIESVREGFPVYSPEREKILREKAGEEKQ